MVNTILKTQKVIKVGNSLAISLDAGFVAGAGIKHGDHLTLRYDVSQQSAVLSTKETPENRYATSSGTKLSKTEKEAYLSKEITPEYQEWVKKTLEEDREAMEELANL